MINNIKLVASFAGKDKSTALSNVLVKDGHMFAQNEMNGISIKVDSDINFCCNAIRLSQALKNCKNGIKTVIKKNKVYISSGSFKSNIDLYPIDSYPLIDIPEENTKIQSNILNEIKNISIFTDPDDVRPFARGVLINKNTIQATNGHVAIKKEITECNVNEKIIPTRSIQLMAKSNAFIDSVSFNGSMIFFNFSDGYLFTKTIDSKFPDIDRIITKIGKITHIQNIAETIESISPLCADNRVIFLGNEIQTKIGDASFSGFDISDSAFNVDLLLKVISVSDEIDFSKYPNPCPFSGDGLVGAIAGIVK